MKRTKEQLAGIYLRYKCQLDSLPEDMVEEFRNATLFVYNRLKRSGVRFEFTTIDPYKDLDELTNDVCNNGEMKIYSGDDNSRLLPGALNLYSRAIHDWIHYFHQLPFGFDGEYQVYEIQKLLYPKHMWPLLYSEIVLQTAFFEVYGYFPEQKIIINI